MKCTTELVGTKRCTTVEDEPKRPRGGRYKMRVKCKQATGVRAGERCGYNRRLAQAVRLGGQVEADKLQRLF